MQRTQALAARHDRQHLLVHKGHDRALRAPARRARRARSRRAGGTLLAGVRARPARQRMPVRWLLSHRAGLAAVKEMLPLEALYDWDAMCAALAAQEPWWEPGTAARLPRRDFRLAGRRGGAAHQRPQSRHVLPRGDRRSARTRSAHRPARRRAPSRRRHERDPDRPDRSRGARPRTGDSLRSAEHGRHGVHQSARRWRSDRTIPSGAAPRFPAPTATAARATWRASTARWRAAARSTACTC